jgi:hypothetical protein
MKVTCDAVEGKVIIGDGENEQVCSYDGELLPIPSSTSEILECPRLATICPELFSCIDSCAGREVCVYDGPVPVCVDAAELLLASAKGVGSSPEFAEDTPEISVDSAATNLSLVGGLWVTLLVLLTL